MSPSQFQQYIATVLDRLCFTNSKTVLPNVIIHRVRGAGSDARDDKADLIPHALSEHNMDDLMRQLSIDTLLEVFRARPKLINTKAINSGYTPLHYAVSEEYTRLAVFLLANKADVNAPDGRHGATPLHTAAMFGKTRMAALLLANNAHVNARDGRFRATPLHLALSKSYEDLVELLLSHGADAEAEDIHGVTPFYFAKAKGYEYALRLMRKYDGGE